MNPGNPYRTALLSISVCVTILSVVILLFSAVASSSSSFEQVAAGGVGVVVAVTLLQLSGVCFLLWLVVSAIGWRAGDTPRPAPTPFARDWAKGEDED